MKKNYESPQIEVLEIEIENTILTLSTTFSTEDFLEGETIG